MQRNSCSRDAALLGQIIPLAELEQWVREEAGDYRERNYGLLRTLMLFIEQVMGGRSQLPRCGSPRREPGSGPPSGAVQLEHGPVLQGTPAFAAGPGAALEPGCCAALERAPGRALEVARPRDQARRRHDGIDARHGRQPQGLPAKQGPKKGLSFPLARLVGVVSLSCATVLDWAMGPYAGKQTGETALLWTLLEHFKPGDVVIADRLYTSYFMIARLMQLGVDVVMRQHQTRHTDFRRGKRPGRRDHVVQWERPARPTWMDHATYAGMPATLTMRELRARAAGPSSAASPM